MRIIAAATLSLVLAACASGSPLPTPYAPPANLGTPYPSVALVRVLAQYTDTLNTTTVKVKGGFTNTGDAAAWNRKDVLLRTGPQTEYTRSVGGVTQKVASLDSLKLELDDDLIVIFETRANPDGSHIAREIRKISPP